MDGSRRFLCLLAVMLWGPACQQQGPSVRAAGPPPADPATRPARSTLPLAKVPPSLGPLADAADAQELPEKALPVVKRAEDLLDKRQFGRAVPQFEIARKLAADSPRILRGLGLAYAGLGDQVKAESCLRTSAEKAPDHVRVHLLLGRYAVTRGDYTGALTHFRKALLCGDADEDSPDSAEALVRAAALLENQGYHAAALECQEKLAGRLSAHGRAFVGRAVLRILVRRPERVLLARGRLLLKLGDADRAAAFLERAYRRDKTHRQAAELAVRALLAKGDFARAEGVVAELLEMPAQRALAVDSAVQLCKAKKDPKLPERLLKTYLDRGGSDSGFVIAMAEAAAELGAPDQAVKMLAGHLATTPEDAPTAIRLARLQARKGDLAAAARQYASLLARDAVGLARMRRELALLARRPIEKEFIRKLPSLAGKAEPRLAPAMLCVAGMLAEAVGDVDLAAALLGRAVKEHPRFWCAYEVLEDLHADTGDSEAMEELADRVTKAAGGSYFKFYLLGKIYLDQQQVEQAVEKLEQARGLRGGHVPTLLLLGRAYQQQGNVRDAERRLLAAMALAPDNLAVATALFELYVRRSGRTEAGRVVARFLRDNPRSVPGRLLAARYYLLVKNRRKAREVLSGLLATAGDDVDVRLFEVRMDLPERITKEHLPAEKAEAALKKIRDILKLDPRNVPARALQAAVLGSQGRHAQAAEALEAVYRRKSHDAVLAGAYLNALIKGGKQKQAAGEVDKIAARKNLSTAMRVMLVEALVEIKNPEKAEALLAKWLKNPANNAELSVLRVRALKLYEQAKRYAAAGELLDRWIASGLEPERLRWLKLQKLRMYALAGKVDEAADYAGKLDPQEWKPYHTNELLIDALLEAKACAKAHEVLEAWARAGAEPAKILKARQLILKSYGEEKRFDDLLRHAQKWMQADPAAEDLNGLAVELLSFHKQHASAVKLAEAWLEKTRGITTTTAPKELALAAAARRAVVVALLRAERKKEALARARAYVKDRPEDPRLLRALLAALHTLEMEKEALALMEKIFKLDPDDPGINNDLGYCWADRGVHLKKAEFMIRKALAARPEQIAFKDSLGWVLYKQGKFDAAHRIFQDAVAADEDLLHAVILDHAGDNCWRLGLKDRAVERWTRAVALAKKEEQKDREVRKVLAETPGKILAASTGAQPKVAPLGENVPEPKP